MIWKAMLIPSMGYIVGLLIGLYVYRKPREYETRKISDSDNVTELKPYILIVTIVAILATFLVQTFTDSKKLFLVHWQGYSYSLFHVHIIGMN